MAGLSGRWTRHHTLCYVAGRLLGNSVRYQRIKEETMRSLCLVLILLSINSVYADTLIHAGQLVDVAAGDVLSEQAIRVQ